MATLAKSAATLYPANNLSASEFYINRPSLVVRRLKLVLTGQGGSQTITAHALGFSLIVWCSALWDDANTRGFPAVVNPVLGTIVLLDGSASPAPINVTSTAAYITVLGVLDNNPALT